MSRLLPYGSALLLLCSASVLSAADADLRDLDVMDWQCLASPSGTAKTPDGIERNAMKNRGLVEVRKAEEVDTAEFLKKVRGYDAHLNAQRRGDLQTAEKSSLAQYENQIVSLTGWLVLAYPGPPETTNCGDRNFHDWHLEMFENPSDHHPQIGDPTPVICEITPRTEQKIYRDAIRLQALAGYFRIGKEYQSTGHAAKKIRVTGFLTWDDDHNGSADVGGLVNNLTANGFHHPWRSTAWEIHPVIKVEVLDSVTNSSPTRTVKPLPPVPPPQSPRANAAPGTEFITLTRPLAIDVQSGEIILQPGERLEVVSRNATKIRVKYARAVYDVPVAAVE